MTETTQTPVIDPQIIEDMKQQALDAAKESLIEKLGGKQQQEKPPESWSALKNETVEMAVSKAEERILSKIEQENKAKAEAQQEEVKKSQAEVEKAQRDEWAAMSLQWKDAVADNVLPDIAPDVKKKLESGIDYDKLTPEEQKDPGLVAYNNTRAKYLADKKEGKSNSFYRTALQERDRKPAGAAAPVFGAAPATAQQTGYTYEEIHKENQAKQKFRF